MHPRTVLTATLACGFVFVAGSCSLDTSGELSMWGHDASADGAPTDAKLADQSTDKPSDAKYDVKQDQKVTDVGKDTAGCFPGTKMCGECVVSESPEFGCAPDTCEPCKVVHGTATCSNESCAVDKCTAPYKDCNGNYPDGCETQVNSLQNCGECGTPCVPPHAVGDCADTTCRIASCTVGWKDCNKTLGDGCEVNSLSDVKNCGTCGFVCEPPTAGDKMVCKQGKCAVDLCTTGTADCDTNPAVCEVNTLSDVHNCGGCGNECSFPNAKASCVNGACVMLDCVAPFGNCDGSTANGCEVNLSSSTSHCGSCAAPCSSANGANPVCSGGLCTLTCTSGFDNCNGAQPGSGDDGCEINIKTDKLNCGSCGGACSTSQGTNPICSNGLCTLTCNAGYADCEDPEPGKTSDGCETNTSSNPSHCGACWAGCDATNGTPGCSAGSCTITCAQGFSNCNGDASDGCEIQSATDVLNCGTCGKACSTNHGTPGCSAGACSISCGVGWGNCNSNVGDGCETDLLTEELHCGACGKACSTNHATPTCTAGACVLSCAPGYADCDGQVANGCEASLNDPARCGSCTKVCSSNHGTATCPSGVCVITCSTGWSNCNSDVSDGCETNTGSDPSHCGSCTNVCNIGGDPHGTATCSSGECGITCNTLWGNCNSTLSDGCEKNLSNDITKWGSCSLSCPASPNMDQQCTLGLCTYSCKNGFGNCDSNPLNGCEATLSSDTANCGSCGNSCSGAANASPSCTGGVCGTPVCNQNFGDCDKDMSNGCEASLLMDKQNCGTCGNKCNGTSSVCNQGQCT